MDTHADACMDGRPRATLVVRNVGQLVTVAQTPISGAAGRLGVIGGGALAAAGDTILWVGRAADLEAAVDTTGAPIVDAGGQVVTPGLVDSHTHLVFAGDRAAEFHLRHQGASYAELLAQGHGILATVRATRAAAAATLRELGRARLRSMRAHGTTTVEAKTGYGLDVETEDRCLQVMAELGREPGLPRLVPTFLGAHTVPLEYRDRRDAYVNQIVEEMLPAFVGRARFCDVFCESGAFTVGESRRILAQARELGYRLKLHANQLGPSGGAALAAELGAVSADHLDYASEAELDALRAAGVVGTLLPGCSFTLQSPYPSARRLLDHGLTVALASDFNPGTSYCENLQMMLALALSAMAMTLEDALLAVTIDGARALALADEVGSLEPGKRCDAVIWRMRDYREFGYHFGVNLAERVIIGGAAAGKRARCAGSLV
jgi:imidazolonepropionase